MTFTLARPGLYGDFAWPSGAGIHDGIDAAGGVDSAGRVRQPGQPVCRARRRPFARSCSAAGAGLEPQSAFCAALFTEAMLISLDRRRRRTLGQRRAVARAERLAAFARWPLHMPVNPDAKVYAVALLLALVSGFLFGAVPVRQVLQHESVRSRQVGIEPAEARAADHCPRHVAGRADCASARCWSLLRWLRCAGWCARCTAISASNRRTRMLVDTDLNMAGYTGDRVPAMQKRMIEAIAAIPGVESVGLADGCRWVMARTTRMSSPTRRPI